MPADMIHRHVDPLETAKEALELLKQGASFHIDFKGNLASKSIVKKYLAAHGYPVNDKGEHMTVSKGADAGHSDPRDGLDESAEMQRILCDEVSPGVSKQERAAKSFEDAQHTLAEFHATRGEESNSGAREAPPYRPDVLRGVELEKAIDVVKAMAAKSTSPELKKAVANFAAEQQARTAEITQDYKDSANTANASLGTGNGGEYHVHDPQREEVAVIGAGYGVSESLGTAQNVGRTQPGYITGREMAGAVPDQADVTGQHADEGSLAGLQKELADVRATTKSGSITDRERDLLQKITLAKLAASHGGR